MDFATLLAPVFTGALASGEDVLPLAVPLVVALVGLGFALRIVGKLGVKR